VTESDTRKKPQCYDIITNYAEIILESDDGMRVGDEERNEKNVLIVGKLLCYIVKFTLASLPLLPQLQPLISR
jgi:hypothetical protein